MKRKLLPDALWEKIEPLIPKRSAESLRKGGRPRVPDRNALEGIIYVLKTATPWEHLPLELGYGSGMTCWRRLREWQEAGVWEKLLRILQQELFDKGKIDLSRVSIDGGHVKAKKGGSKQAPVLWTGGGSAVNIT